MPSIVAINAHQRAGAGYIAGIRYRSGRTIFVGENPDAGEFVEAAYNARVFADSHEAESAALRLVEAFEVRDPSALHLFVERYSR